MNEREQQLIKQAHQVFMRFGIKSVTMDDMARNLGISKKTLYQHVSDKNDLVTKVLQWDCCVDQESIHEIVSRGLNAIDENVEIGKFIVERLRSIHPSIHFDLEKYHSEAWKESRRETQKLIVELVSQNLKKGIEQGLYRHDLNIPVIAKVYMSRFDIVFDPEIFPPQEYDFAEVYLEMLRYHIRGIASEQGTKYLIDKLNKENQN